MANSHITAATIMDHFSMKHLGRWKEGSLPPRLSDSINEETHDGLIWTVSYDGTHDAYFVYDDEYEEFIEFVAIGWASENDWQGMNEKSDEYLERIDVQIAQQGSYPLSSY